MNSPDKAVVIERDDEPKIECTYCNSLGHLISQCEIFDSHHEPEAKNDPGRDMVLARRQAIMFGGIPEEYLKNPSQEQQKKARAFRDSENERFRAYMKKFIEEEILPKKKNEK